MRVTCNPRAMPVSISKFLKLHLYPTFSAIMVAYLSSDLEDSAAKNENKERNLLKNSIPVHYYVWAEV